MIDLANIFYKKIFFPKEKDLFFYLIIFIFYFLALILLIWLAIIKSVYIYPVFYIVLIFSFTIVGVEAGITVSILGIITNFLGLFFQQKFSIPLTVLTNIILILFIAFFLTFFINEIERRKKNIEIKSQVNQKKLIEKKEEYQKIQQQIKGNKLRIKNYTLLNEVAQKLATTLEKEEIYTTIANYINQLLNNKQVNFDFLIWNKELGIYENITQSINLKQENETIKLYKKDSFDEWVETRKGTLIIKNIDEDYRFKMIKKDKINFKSLISIPLILKQEIIGILKVYSDKANYFDSDDARILNYLGDLCTIVVQNSILYSKTKELAIKDGLTGLYMRRYFIEKLDEEIKRAKHLNSTFSFLMIDIDHFKQCNDTYGHLFGDKVLKILGEFLKDNLRDVDIIGRYGGEEFAVILTNTNLNGAHFVAERLRSDFEKLIIKVNENEGKKITLSIGGVEYKKDMKLMEVINYADKALYHSKETGRNKVTFWEDIR